MDVSRPFRVVTHVWWDGPFYTEGPMLDNQGNRYFTTLNGGQVMRAEPGDNAACLISATCPNGLAMFPGGDLVFCDSKEAALKRFDTFGTFIRDEIKGECAGEWVLAPNDVIVDAEGGLYFTDSVRYHGKVFYKGVDGNERLLASKLDYPNGLVLSPQSDQLFIAESYQNRVLVLDIGRNNISSYRVFSSLPQHSSGITTGNLPDGMAQDIWGNLWVAHYGMGALQVLDRSGKLIATIETGIPLTSNLCFLGFDPLCVMVTGGFGEPGPGRVVIITIEQKWCRNEN